MKLTIGTRGSALALWQAHHTKDSLENLGHDVELSIIKTQGDKIQHLSFDKMEGKGFFTKEIEDHLLDQRVDLAVHSHKDLETTEPEGLTVMAVSRREDPSELLLIRKSAVDSSQKFSLKKGGIVGTSSARRKSQLDFFRPDVEIKDLRGNVPTRIQKLRDGQYDAIMLARAGVSRLDLDLSDLHVEILDPTEFIPAPAQGVLAWQGRGKDSDVAQVVKALDDGESALTTRVERGILKGCNGGCQLPLGVYCQKNDSLELWVSHAADLNSATKRFYLKGDDPDELVAEALRIIDQKDEKKKS